MVGPGLLSNDGSRAARLPGDDVPSELPPDCSIQTPGTDEIAEPWYVEERSTGTDSWILRDAPPVLPETGTYYAVAYAPADEHGDLRLSSGKRKGFGLSDVGRMRGWTRKVRRFHEIHGRSPGSFAGVAWCFGEHDRPWKERPIFGKVRYMKAAGLETRFDMDAYLARVNALVDGTV